MIAAPDARCGKRIGDLIGPRVELRIREAFLAADERLSVGSSTRVLLEHRGQVQHGSAEMLTQLVDRVVDRSYEVFRSERHAQETHAFVIGVALVLK